MSKEMINLAEKIAYEAHMGQVDKGGEDYIKHPLRLVNMLYNDLFFNWLIEAIVSKQVAKKKISDVEVFQMHINLQNKLIIVALLHDTLEDTSLTSKDLLKKGIPIEVVSTVEVLSRDRKTDYFDYIREIKKDEVATLVKMADLLDNMDYNRLKNITKKDISRMEKYENAFKILLSRFSLKLKD